MVLVVVGAVVAVAVAYFVRPYITPLEVIPSPGVEDPLVTCRGIRAVRYSQLVDPPSIDEVDHPAVDALRAELRDPGGAPMPRGDWVVINIGDDQAAFAALTPDEFGYARFERSGGEWKWDGSGWGRPCKPTLVLPSRLERVEVRVDPDSPLSPDSMTIDLLVTEAGCASGREMGRALRGPQVVETETSVLVGFAVVPPLALSVDCPANPCTRVTVELSRPLGRRTIYDGTHFPPKRLAAVSEGE